MLLDFHSHQPPPMTLTNVLRFPFRQGNNHAQIHHTGYSAPSSRYLMASHSTPGLSQPKGCLQAMNMSHFMQKKCSPSAVHHSMMPPSPLHTLDTSWSFVALLAQNGVPRFVPTPKDFTCSPQNFATTDTPTSFTARKQGFTNTLPNHILFVSESNLFSVNPILSRIRLLSFCMIRAT